MDNILNQQTDDLRNQASQQVVEKNGQWVINQFDKPIQGFDFTRTYQTREQAIDAAYNLLRTHRKVA